MVMMNQILARCPRTVLITAVRAAGQVNQLLLLLLLLITIDGQCGDRCHRRQGRCGRSVRTGSCPNGSSTIDHIRGKRDASTGIMRTITVSTVVNQNVASFIACVSEPTYGPPMT
uniref:Secreted protein n=1 Tax=Anopheles melas TaxID=34690 RepID=A0A182TI29_9DIPT